MKKRGPKVKSSRRLGIPLTPKASRTMGRKPSSLGQHDRRQHLTQFTGRNKSTS